MGQQWEKMERQMEQQGQKMERQTTDRHGELISLLKQATSYVAGYSPNFNLPSLTLDRHQGTVLPETICFSRNLEHMLLHKPTKVDDNGSYHKESHETAPITERVSAMAPTTTTYAEPVMSRLSRRPPP